MCGIVGGWLRAPETWFPVRRMAEAIKHRGPDDEGYVLLSADGSDFSERGGSDTDSRIQMRSVDEPWPEWTRIALAHRRLSIVDLSERGHQPMSDREASLWITYNGEIYNYEELRKELEASGAVFRTGTDTEVVLKAYRAWGEDCLGRFNGMWAFAIWDGRKKILFCARDRFGVKPFYYTRHSSGFFFASEIKALLELEDLKREPCEEAVFDYLASALVDHGEMTFFKGIFRLEAGCALTVSGNGQAAIKRWYEPPTFDAPSGVYHAEAAGRFGDMLRDAVRLRLRSDVPVGSCLSGGLDSSSIVCIASQFRAEPLHTFTSCFEDPQFDERIFAREVWQSASVVPHTVFPASSLFWQEWADLVWQQEEPFGSTSIYAQWCVMREAASAGIPVLLDGQGADELLGGYLRYRLNRAAGAWNQGFWNGFSRAIEQPRSLAISAFFLVPEAIRRFAAKKWLRNRNGFNASFAARHEKRNAEYVLDRASKQKSLNEALRSDFLRYSLPSLLRYEDKNSMRFGVESRLPFLDYRLVESVFALGEKAKIDEERTKIVLRDAMGGVVPDAIRLRKDKMGFVTPEKKWILEGAALARNWFESSGVSLIGQWVNLRSVKDLLSQSSFDTRFAWRVINLEMWCRVFFEKSKSYENTHSESVLSA